MKLYDNDAYRDRFAEAVYTLLSDDGTNDRANQIIDLFDAAPEVEAEPLPANDLLTLEELREMDGEPVYAEFLDSDYSPCWMLLKCVVGRAFYSDHFSVALNDYGATWLAYRRSRNIILGGRNAKSVQTPPPAAQGAEKAAAEYVGDL